MKATLRGVAVGLVVGALATWLVWGRPSAHPDSAPHTSDTSDASGAAVLKRSPDGAVLRVSTGVRDRIGVQLAPLAAGERAQEVRGVGRLLEPSLLAAPLYDRDSARAALDTAEREYQRVQTLQRGNANASQRELDAARAALERDRNTFEGAQARLVSVWGPDAGARSDLPALVRSLVSREAALARIDLSVGETLSGHPTGGRVAPLGREEAEPVPATVLGPAPDADPVTQGRGFLLRLGRVPWPPGTAVVGWLALEGPSQGGVIVPRSAVVRYEGRSFVYVESANDTIERRAVQLDHPTHDGWFVQTGLAAGELVVVTGAQQLLSTELAGSTAED